MPSPEEESRRSPEFSPGERIKGVETELAALDRRFGEISDLFDEKLSGLRRELGGVNSALKDSVEKAEAAQQRQFQTFVEQNDRKAEVSAQRFAALERGEAGNSGVREWLGRFALVVSAITAVGVLIFYIAHA